LAKSLVFDNRVTSLANQEFHKMPIFERKSPLRIKIGFKELFERYEKQLSNTNIMVRERAERILSYRDKYPILSEGIEDLKTLEKYDQQIYEILEDLFSEILTNNEIKIATLPFQTKIFRASQRFVDLQKTSGKDFKLELLDFDEDAYYIMACTIILSHYYDYKVDFKRTLYYQIPFDNGIVRSYRVLNNADFVSIEKGPEAKDITHADVVELLDNYGDIKLWKEKFPENSWIFNGFVIANMYDATNELALSQFKEDLIGIELKDGAMFQRFQSSVRTVFNMPDIHIGFSLFDKEEGTLNHLGKVPKTESYILEKDECMHCKSSLCEKSYQKLFEEKDIYTISDIPASLKADPNNTLLEHLSKHELGSAIFVPLVSKGEHIGVLEIVSPNVRDLNSVNAQKLNDFLPFLLESLRKEIDKFENEVDLLIQEECTSIHKSVYWRFRKEAHRVLKMQDQGWPVNFQEVVFNDVYPLFGQMDIRESSKARNEATQRDLELQLRMVKRILEKVHSVEPLPIYEKLIFTLEEFISEIDDTLEVDSERRVLLFLQKEIHPYFKHLSKINDDVKGLIESYQKRIDEDKGFVYKNRKAYDESVMQVNKVLSGLLDKKQVGAQEMYPHFYERFKTDGVEHNMYIGEAITREESFNKIYLFNLRLWQIQVMCEMENAFYHLKTELPVPMNIASMILVFNNPLALRFRLDEKRFDVDGTYNARYEVVKKRVDKATIKGTEERITQPGKLAIIYSQEEDEQEYLNYIRFLQSKNYLGEEVEILELEDLQGVTGLQALRVNILYHHDDDKKLYTYEDLMEELKL